MQLEELKIKVDSLLTAPREAALSDDEETRPLVGWLSKVGDAATLRDLFVYICKFQQGRPCRLCLQAMSCVIHRLALIGSSESGLVLVELFIDSDLHIDGELADIVADGILQARAVTLPHLLVKSREHRDPTIQALIKAMEVDSSG